MNTVITAKQMLDSLPEIIRKVGKGGHFTVLYRGRPAFQVLPLGAPTIPTDDPVRDSLYQAKAVGRSRDGKGAADHDLVLS
jgi:antitoxin (DNA-binding transcriptional repressor) of toxin-antitoxin stability system